MRHYEDIAVGEEAELGSRVIERDAMLAFSETFDRLPFHVDEAAAERSMFKGLIASGLHTVSAAAGIVVDHYLRETSMTGASGMDGVRWLQPVRPGDRLRVHIKVLDDLNLDPAVRNKIMVGNAERLLNMTFA